MLNDIWVYKNTSLIMLALLLIAVVMLAKGISAAQAAELLQKNGGFLRPEDVNAACREGDQAALEIIRNSGQMIGEVLASLFGAGDNPTAERVIWRVRLPRVLTAVCVGAALGMAGSIFQSISRNALGSPDIIGFTTGAASGAIVQIILFNAGPLGTSLAAVLSGICTAALVFVLSMKGRTTGGYRLVLEPGHA